MKKLATLLTIILSAFLLVSCDFFDKDETPEGKAEMTGVVTSVSSGISISVNDEAYTNEPFHVIINDNTVFYNADGSTSSFSSVHLGDTVKITYNGQMMLSYPAQIVAIRVDILGNYKGEQPINSVKMNGVVTDVGDRIAILVTEDAYKDQPMHVLTNEKTLFFDESGNQTTKSSIKVGDTILVTYSGQVMMSYPGQISALTITIK